MSVVGFLVYRKLSGSRQRRGFRRLSRSNVDSPDSFANIDSFSGSPSEFDYVREDSPIFGDGEGL